MPARIRLVVTAGPLDGRGHLGRALSLAEALAERGTAAELQLLAGSMSPNEAARAAAASLAVVVGRTWRWRRASPWSWTCPILGPRRRSTPSACS